jgi:hypothetical protein
MEGNIPEKPSCPNPAGPVTQGIQPRGGSIPNGEARLSRRIHSAFRQPFVKRYYNKRSLFYPLPPRDPPLGLDGELAPLLARAEEQVRLLDLAGDLVPSVEWFVYAFVRKEAVLSAQIEGTQATLMDLLEVEASGEDPADADVEEVCSYVGALGYAWEELGRESGLPLSMRLLSETHRKLLSGARGSQKQPGDCTPSSLSIERGSWPAKTPR